MRTINLDGTSMSALALAIPELEKRTNKPVIVIGGLAVTFRLSHPYRSTSDLDTVNRRATGEQPQLEILLAGDATASGPSGVLIPTSAGPVQVDVLEVSDADLNPLPTDPTDRLHVLSHAWAAATATKLAISSSRTADLTVAVAEPGPLIAMKLQSLMNRPAVKEATDLTDIVRLTLDPSAGPSARTQLELADQQLRRDAALHARRWFLDHSERSLRRIRSIPEGHTLHRDDLALTAELLLAALDKAAPDGEHPVRH